MPSTERLIKSDPQQTWITRSAGHYAILTGHPDLPRRSVF